MWMSIDGVDVGSMDLNYFMNKEEQGFFVIFPVDGFLEFSHQESEALVKALFGTRCLSIIICTRGNGKESDDDLNPSRGPIKYGQYSPK